MKCDELENGSLLVPPEKGLMRSRFWIDEVELERYGKTRYRIQEFWVSA